MKTTIPEDLKKDIPLTTMGKLLLATPVVMTVIATMLAGLASSEMTRAQYDRAYAAQLQSKAGDQWNYFQAKKLRSAMQRNTLELLEATAEVRPLDAAKLSVALTPEALVALQKGELPFNFTNFQLPAVDQAALDAVASSKSESEITDLLAKLDERSLIDDLTQAKMQMLAFEEATKPINEAIAQLEKSLPVGDKAAARDLTAAKMRYNAARYEAEAKLNQAIANVLELRVRKSNISAERHHKRSGKFFFGMLAAQAAVIVSTFSLAAQKRNFLWSVAAIAGAVALAFAIYVFLFI